MSKKEFFASEIKDNKPNSNKYGIP